MRSTARAPLRLARGSEPRAPAGARCPSWMLGCLGVAALVAAFFAVSHWKRKVSEVSEVPEDRRVAAFSRSLEELRRSCGAGRPDAFDEHCRELASFLAQFGECRGECQAIVQRELAPNPTR